MQNNAVSMCRECPDDHVLLVVGHVDVQSYQGILSHVDSCKECQDRLESMFGGFREEEPKRLRSVPRVANYEILGDLGQGGMGVVYRARDTRLKREVALKTLAAQLHTGSDEYRRLRREAEIVAALRHENIVQIHDIVESEGRLYLALELMDTSLADRVKVIPMPPREAAQLVSTLARAVHFAHTRGVVHRDLKPANILLTSDGVPKVCDFGLAKKVDESRRLSQSGEFIGTIAYMAPEQVRGDPATAVSDVWALGVILFELLSCQRPYAGETGTELIRRVQEEEPRSPRSLNPDVPRDLAAVNLRCLEKSPPRRYPTAEALADDLDRFLNGEAVQARGSWFDRLVQPWSRNRLVGGYSGWPLMLLATAILGGLMNWINWACNTFDAMEYFWPANLASWPIRFAVFYWGYRISAGNTQARQILWILVGNVFTCSALTMAVNAMRGGSLLIDTWNNNAPVPLWCIANAFCSFVLARSSFAMRWLYAGTVGYAMLAIVTILFRRDASLIFGVAWFITFAAGAAFLRLREKAWI